MEVSGQLLTPWRCMAEWISSSTHSEPQYMEVNSQLWHHEGVSRSGCQAPLILNLSTTWRWVVSFSRHEGVWRSGCKTPLILNLSTIHGGEWSASSLGHFTSNTHWVGYWLGTTSKIDILETCQSFALPKGRPTTSLASTPSPCHYTKSFSCGGLFILPLTAANLVHFWLQLRTVPV